MASKILKLNLLLGLISLINSKSVTYQQTLNKPGFSSSEHQVLFQKVGFYAATVQYLHVVIPIPLAETIDSLVKMSDELGQYQKDQLKIQSPMANINGALVKSARTRIAKIVSNIYAIIDSLPEDQRLAKRQIAEIFGAVSGAVGTLMGLFNSVEIKRIAAGVGENRKKINSIIDITRLTDEHLKNLDISVDKISNIQLLDPPFTQLT